LLAVEDGEKDVQDVEDGEKDVQDKTEAVGKKVTKTTENARCP